MSKKERRKRQRERQRQASQTKEEEESAFVNTPVPSPGPETSPESKASIPILLQLTRSTFMLNLVVGVLRMMAGISFWWTVIQGYLLIVLALAELWLEPLFARRKWLTVTLTGIIVIGLIWFSREVVFVSAPLNMSAGSHVDIYGPGSKLHGIEWLPRYSELTVEINNPTSTDYDSFDAQITTDLAINQLIQTSGLGTCKVEGVHATEAPHWQHMHGDRPVGAIDDPSWGYEVIPKDKHGKPIVPFYGADWTYRVRCDKILANDRIRLFGALSMVNKHMYDEPGCLVPCPWPFFDPPQPAKWVKLVASFQTSGRKRSKEISRCSVGNTCEVR